eukprot:1875906-Prymnesium_polylepis.2
MWPSSARGSREASSGMPAGTRRSRGSRAAARRCGLRAARDASGREQARTQRAHEHHHAVAAGTGRCGVTAAVRGDATVAACGAVQRWRCGSGR